MTETDDSLQVGIVGLGTIGELHVNNLLALGETLAGGVDIVDEARTAFEREHDAPAFESLEALIDHGVDALIITTPNRFHEEYALEAFDAGVDVLCEKPLANDLESAERIAEAAAESDARCMVGFNNRFLPAVEVFSAEREAGRFGDLTHVDANYIRRRGVPGRGGWFTTKDISGGGALLDIGVHAIDLTLHLLGYPEVVEVSGQTRSEFGGREDYTFLQMWGEDADELAFDVEDHATAFLRTAEGQTVSLEAAWASNRPPDNEFVVEGTDGGATLDRDENTLTIHEVDDTGVANFRDTVVETAETDPHREEQAYFFDAIRNDEPIERNTVEEALTVQRVIDAIYRSDEHGRAVQLED